MKFHALLVGILLIFGAASAYAGFGSIAYSPSTTRWGNSYGQPTRWIADSVAVSNCGVADCSVIVWEQNQCAALAVGSGSYNYGWGLDLSAAAAENRALFECGLRDPYCNIIAWTCY